MPSLYAQEPLGTVNNAATVLRQAIELMPQLTTEQKKWLRDGPGPVDEGHEALLQSLEPSLQLLYQAADMPECEWGLPWEEDGPNTTVPHVWPVLNLASMAQRHAEAQLPHNPSGFLKDEFAALSSARHTGRSGPMVSLLTEYAIESKVVDALALHLPALPDDALASLVTQWDNMPPGGDLHTAISMEKATGADWFIKKVRQAMEKHRAGRDGTPSHASSASALADQFRLAGIVEIDGLPIRIGLETREGNSFFLRVGQEKHGLELLSADFEREEAVLVKDGQTALLKLRSGQFIPIDLQVSREVVAEIITNLTVGTEPETVMQFITENNLSVLEMLQQTSANYDRLLEALSLPPDEFRQWSSVFEEEITNNNPLSKVMMPAFLPARERVDGVLVRREMLKVAITVLQTGPEAVNNSVDPFGTGPFTCRQTEGGFELVSALTVKGKPVTLSVGDAPQL